jgi:hypothetical protein
MKSIVQSIDSGSVPVIFSDGTKLYKELAEKYELHDKGLFILAPSGVGKTYYVNHQSKMDWIDGDSLWTVAGADYSQDEWGDNLDDVMEINARCDVITYQAKKQGFWVLGSSNYFLKPDAVVIPDWDTHLKFITARQESNYDGGATTDDLAGLRSHIQWITKTWQNKVPFFKSIETAATHLTRPIDI